MYILYRCVYTVFIYILYIISVVMFPIQKMYSVCIVVLKLREWDPLTFNTLLWQSWVKGRDIATGVPTWFFSCLAKNISSFLKERKENDSYPSVQKNSIFITINMKWIVVYQVLTFRKLWNHHKNNVTHVTHFSSLIIGSWIVNCELRVHSVTASYGSRKGGL